MFLFSLKFGISLNLHYLCKIIYFEKKITKFKQYEYFLQLAERVRRLQPYPR